MPGKRWPDYYTFDNSPFDIVLDKCQINILHAYLSQIA